MPRQTPNDRCSEGGREQARALLRYVLLERG